MKILFLRYFFKLIFLLNIFGNGDMIEKIMIGKKIMLKFIQNILEKKSDDRDFSMWQKYFETLSQLNANKKIDLMKKVHLSLEEKKILIDFKKNIMKKDSYFLEHSRELGFDDENYENNYAGGFMEKCFQSLMNIDSVIEETIIADKNEIEQESEDYIYRKNQVQERKMSSKNYLMMQMIAISIKNGLTFDVLKEKFNSKFKEIIEAVIMYHDNELTEIEDEKLISRCVDKNLIEKHNFIELAFLRGTILSSREE